MSAKATTILLTTILDCFDSRDDPETEKASER